MSTGRIIQKLIESGSPRLLPALVAVRLTEMQIDGASLHTLAGGDVAAYHRWRRFIEKPAKLLAPPDVAALAQALGVERGVVEVAALLDHARLVGYETPERLLAGVTPPSPAGA